MVRSEDLYNILSKRNIPIIVMEPGRPQNISIPDVFRTVNTLRRYPDDWRSKNFYNGLKKRYGAASDCIACGQRESVCPQHLHIIDLLKQASEILD